MSIDKKAFEMFYRENIDKIYRYVFFRVNGNKELAEELVSEIFIKALEKFSTFDERISKTAWIYTIAKNHLANYWRDKKEVVFISEIENEDGESMEFLWWEKAKIEWQRQKEKSSIYEYLANLSQDEREIVTLHYLSGYNYREIANMKDKTETAVKVMAHRALKKIKKGSVE